MAFDTQTNYLSKTLEDLNFQYEILNDGDGSFLFPKGVKQMDDALISEIVYWLNDYPKTQKEYASALRKYSECNQATASDTADSFRKALERFFQEFFGGEKSLENFKSEYGTYLRNHNIPSELSNNFETLLQSYTNFMNNYAKHHDKTSLYALEYIMYQTGNIIRLLITLKQNP